MNMSLIILEDTYGDIDADYYSCHGYYIIQFPFLHIPFKQTLVLMVKLFLPVEWYVKELITFQSILIVIIMS